MTEVRSEGPLGGALAYRVGTTEQR